MKLIRTVILIIFLLIFTILVTACFRSIPQFQLEQIVSATPKNQIQINEIFLEMSPTPTPLETFILPRNQSPSPTIHPPLTAYSTSTPQPTPTIQVPLKLIQTGSSGYSLSYPSPEKLIKLQLSRSSQFLYSNTQIDELLYPSFHTIIDFEWKEVYPKFGDPTELVKLIPNYYDHINGRLTNSMLIDIIGDYFIHLLNVHQIRIENNKPFQVDEFSGIGYQLEIDGDLTPEWLIKIQNPNGYYLGEDSFWITIDQESVIQYRRLENQIPWQYGFSTLISPTENSTDLTGDHIPDIVVIDDSMNPGGPQFTAHIAMGSPQGFFSIPSSPLVDPLSAFKNSFVSYDWLISSETELPALELNTTSEIGSWPCKVIETKVIQWVDGIEQVKEYPPVIPDTADCDIAQSLESGSPGNYQVRIQVLNNALSHSDELIPEVRLFVIYRLALLHLLDNEKDKADYFLDQIDEIAKKGSPSIATSLMDEIRPLRSNQSLNPYHLCLAAEAISSFTPADPLDSSTQMKNISYIGFPEGYPTHLCDTYQMKADFLHWASPYPDDSLSDELTTAAIPYLQTMKLTNNPQNPLWIVILQDDLPENNLASLTLMENTPERFISVYGFLGDEWQEIHVSHNSAPVSINGKDLTKDGIVDFILAQPSRNNNGNPCVGEELIDIFMITPVYEQWLIPFSVKICSPSPSFLDYEAILQDEDGNGIVDKVTQYYERHLFDLTLLGDINLAQPAILTQEWYPTLYSLTNKDYISTEFTKRTVSHNYDESLRSEIEHYLRRWDGDDQADKYIRAQLKYLLAIIFKREGDDESAALQYYDIWRHQPDTIWAYLASNRLQISNED